MNALTDRRSMILGAFTAGAVAIVAAIPAMVDRAFALLEAHKAAFGHYLDLEEQLGDSEDLAAFKALGTAARAVDVALDEITTTPPTTIAGMRAVMEYLVGSDGQMDYLPTLLRSSLLRSPLLAG
jgi:hypothetical protein